MRLWSIHPRYLDTKGLVALWREGLLALHVLQGKTKGYKNHPQLIRFKETKNPILYISSYLWGVYKEAVLRNYNFNKKKLLPYKKLSIKVTEGQLKYEFNHLKNKLIIRDQIKYKEIIKEKNILVHPIFKIIKGKVEGWEKI